MSQTDVTAPWSDAADPRRRIGHAVEFHAAIGSTNDRARELLAEGRPGVAVVADLQTAGRGRRGRHWASPAGVNLMCSVGIVTQLAARDAGLLGGAVALAAVQAAEPWAALVVRWPNDLVTDEGLKVGGLLVETAVSGERITSAVIGIGINANWRRGDMPAEIRDGATSLLELGGAEVDRVRLLGRVLERLDREVGDFEAGLTPVPRLRARSWLDGAPIEVDTGDAVVRGVGAGIAEDGSLLVDTDAGRLALAHGEVVRVQPAGEPE
jgi:BirA family transcriptional regulator, biotin operon repressor / biotin---[acetyl-CoA-carboxylase] ligase